MKVQNSEYSLSQKESELRNLNQKLDRKIRSKEQEIKDVDKEYATKKESTQVEHENNLQQILESNNQKIIVESKGYEDKISNYKNKLRELESGLNRQENILKGQEQEKIQNLRNELEITRGLEASRLGELQRVAQQQSKEQAHEINRSQRDEKSKIEQQAFLDIQKYSNEHNQKIKRSENMQTKEMQDLIRRNESTKKTTLATLDQANQQEIKKNQKINGEYVRIGTNELELQKKFQQNQMTQLQNDFQTRFELMQKNHTQTLNDLKTKFNDEITKKVEKNSSLREVFEKKAEDPFYRVSILRPKVLEKEREVVVSLPISDFEKDNLHLSTNNRMVKITLNRNYADKLAEEGKTFNKSTRSELFSKEFEVKDLLDARNITKSYEGGVLTFTINKA